MRRLFVAGIALFLAGVALVLAFRRLFVAGIALFLVGVSFVLIFTGCDAEPIYEGRTLAHWRRELKNKDAMARTHAAAIFAMAGSRGKQAIPDLTEGLKDEHYMVPFEAALALAKMGPEAKVAIPALTELYNKHWNDKVRNAAAAALMELDPEAAERAGVKLSDEE